MTQVVHAENSNGDHAIGIEVDGVFVPFAVVQAHRVQHYVDRAGVLAERADGDDPELAGPAQAALDGEYVVSKSRASSSSSKTDKAKEE